MIVLGIESSTPSASAALVEPEGLRGQISLNTGLTHSEQLLPLIDQLLTLTKTKLTMVQGLAVSAGPGSFTGLRIGMATAKGLAQGLGIPLVGVSTLQAWSYGFSDFPGLIAPVMNARRGEVYAALYRYNRDCGQELAGARAVTPERWVQELKMYKEQVLLVGDGVTPYRSYWEDSLQGQAVFPPLISLPAQAAGVAWLGRERLLSGDRDDLYGLKPFYIRPAEAQVKRAKAK